MIKFKFGFLNDAISGKICARDNSYIVCVSDGSIISGLNWLIEEKKTKINTKQTNR